MIRCRLLLLLLLVTASQAFAQQADPSILTLDRIFSSPEFVSQVLGPVRWTDGGAGYTRLEPSAALKNGTDIAPGTTKAKPLGANLW